MRRELIIEKTNGAGDWVALDLGDEVPAMVFQINDLNDLKDRQTSYSQALSLPISPNNCRAFGFADEFDARSQSPYQIHRCAWYEDGIQIIGTNFRLELLSVSDVFNCQIVSNLLGLFETLQAKAMNELVIAPILWNQNTIKSVLESNTKDSLYTFAPGLNSQREPGVYQRTNVALDFAPNSGAQLVAGTFPYFRLIPLVREILSQSGYTLDTDVESVPGYEPDLLSLADLVPGAASFEPLNRKANGSPITITSSDIDSNGYLIAEKYLLSDLASNTFNYSEVRLMSLKDTASTTIRTKGYEYTSPGYMKTRVKLLAQSNSATDETSRVRYRVQKFGNEIPGPDRGSYKQIVIAETDVLVGNTTSHTPFITEEFELVPGEKIYVEVILIKGVAGTTYTGSFEVAIPAESNAVPAGGYIYPEKSTDFKNQLEVIKLFVQLYGLFVDVDSDNKVLRAYNLNKIVDRVKLGDFADWSGKVDTNRSKNSRETTFRIGSYEQQNRILFGSNDLLGIQKYGSIRVNNANLQAIKDLFTIAAESSENAAAYSPASMPIEQEMEIDVRYTQDDGAGWAYIRASDPIPGYGQTQGVIPLVKYRKSKTHIVRLSPMKDGTIPGPGNFSVSIIPGGYAPASVTARIPTNYAFVAVSVDPQTYIDTYYPILENNILNPARLVEDVFNLTPSDISNLDLLRPVYIEEYGAFFYIQKINNYQARKLTKVILVCLNRAGDQTI